MSDILKRAYEIVGLGNFGSNSHPIHPMTVHFPIAFLTGANVLNILYGLAIYFPLLCPFTVDVENTGTLTIIGYGLNLAGIVTAVPTLLTGFAELYAMVNSRGLFVKDEKTGEKKLEPVVKTTITHAGLNDLAVGIAVYNWLMERNRGFEDFRPHSHLILLSVTAMGLTMYAAYLGGALVYSQGVGVQRMGHAKEEKGKKEA